MNVELGLGNVHKLKLDTYAANVEAILINPNWHITDKRASHTVTVEEFGQIQFSNKLMIDGLIFVWVEKEILFPVIKILEKQDFIYVENICWVMLDESKR